HQRDGGLERREGEVNGQPAVLAMREGRVVVAILLSVADGRIHNVYIHADPAHLGHVGAASSAGLRVREGRLSGTRRT
ncbi:MAG TPA: hypothetical protein VIF09_05375, partial [Polyangiaceae bacterium]